MFTMNVLSSLTLMLFIGHFTFQEARAKIEVTYQDLIDIDAACRPRDTCSEPRFGDGITSNYSCNCSPRCSKLGTCCLDSPYRHTMAPGLKPSCIYVGGPGWIKGYFMIDKCAAHDQITSALKNKCESEWDGSDHSLVSLTPVTSLVSSMTYKNYYCFRCHETTDEFMFWEVELNGNSKNLESRNSFTVTYDQTRNTWLAVEGGRRRGSTPIPVELRFVVPKNITSLADKCDPSAVDDCPDSWTDDVVREKCHSYTALVCIDKGAETPRYRNPHCAVCNSEPMDKMACDPAVFISKDPGKKAFSFSRLLRINLKSGRNCEENFVWDPFFKRCRKLVCAIPGHVVKDGRCAPP